MSCGLLHTPCSVIRQLNGWQEGAQAAAPAGRSLLRLLGDGEATNQFSSGPKSCKTKTCLMKPAG